MEFRKKTKQDKVLQHLKEKGTITSWEAIQKYRVTRLSAIIYNLKDKGHVIRTHNKSTEDGTFAEYELIS
jgi:hypothetical protein